jgi:hypothetical protein
MQPAQNDFGNQLLIVQRLTRTKNANCALLCPLFNGFWRIRLNTRFRRNKGLN